MLETENNILGYLFVEQTCPQCKGVYLLSLEKMRNFQKPVTCPNSACGASLQVLPFAPDQETGERVDFAKQLETFHISFLTLYGSLTRVGYSLSFSTPPDVEHEPKA